MLLRNGDTLELEEVRAQCVAVDEQWRADGSCVGIFPVSENSIRAIAAYALCVPSWTCAMKKLDVSAISTLSRHAVAAAVSAKTPSKKYCSVGSTGAVSHFEVSSSRLKAWCVSSDEK